MQDSTRPNRRPNIKRRAIKVILSFCAMAFGGFGLYVIQKWTEAPSISINAGKYGPDCRSFVFCLDPGVQSGDVVASIPVGVDNDGPRALKSVVVRFHYPAELRAENADLVALNVVDPHRSGPDRSRGGRVAVARIDGEWIEKRKIAQVGNSVAVEHSVGVVRPGERILLADIVRVPVSGKAPAQAKPWSGLDVVGHYKIRVDVLCEEIEPQSLYLDACWIRHPMARSDFDEVSHQALDPLERDIIERHYQDVWEGSPPSPGTKFRVPWEAMPFQDRRFCFMVPRISTTEVAGRSLHVAVDYTPKYYAVIKQRVPRIDSDSK